MGPPGPPPVFQPRFDGPATWEEALKAPAPKSEVVALESLSPGERKGIEADRTQRAANEGLVEGEDGHVALHGRLVASARAQPAKPLPHGVVDVGRTSLAAWSFRGYLQEFSPNRVSRLFARDDGTLLYFQEWNYAADGGAIIAFEGAPTIAIGPHRGAEGGVRGRSGCVLTALSWHDDRRQYTLETSGPLSLAEQRELLRSIAHSVVSQPGR